MQKYAMNHNTIPGLSCPLVWNSYITLESHAGLEQRDKAFSSKHVSIIIAAAAAAALIMTGAYLLLKASMF